MAEACVHIFVSGRVQGIGFRSYVHRKAQFMGLVGWVRNLSDGRVEVLAEGKAEKLEELIEACRRGPPLARVVNVEVFKESPRGAFSSFRVRG